MIYRAVYCFNIYVGRIVMTSEDIIPASVNIANIGATFIIEIINKDHFCKWAKCVENLIDGPFVKTIENPVDDDEINRG